MSSKFYAAGSSSEDESEEERQNSESEEEVSNDSASQSGSDSEEEQVPSRFARGESEGEEEEVKRVARSVKDRRFDELNESVRKIKVATNANDWAAVSNEFDKLNKQMSTPKVQELIKKDGKGTPRFYLQALVAIEDQVAEVDAKKPKLNPTNSKNFKAMKQTIKKHNKNYEKDIQEYRKNPVEAIESKSDSESEQSSDEEKDIVPVKEKEKAKGDTKKPVAKPVVNSSIPSKWLAKPKAKDEESSSDSEDINDNMDDSESDDEPSANDWVAVPAKGGKPGKGQKPQPAKVVPVAAQPVKPVEPEKPKELSPEDIKKAMKEILSLRGKRATDPAKQEEKLRELLPHAKDAELQVDVLMNLISFQFDSTRAVSHLTFDKWKAVLTNLNTVLTLLEKNPNVSLHEEATPLVDVQNQDDQDEESETKLVSGSLLAYIQRVDDEFLKSLQSLDPHTQEYVQRLQDEGTLMDLAERAQAYYTKTGNMRAAARIAIRRVEHIYYKPEVDNKEQLDKLSQTVYANGDERMKTRMILCHTYYLALHDQFYEARDMMLMSHLQDSIINADVPTQILFNRTMVQLGLCAFRNNTIKQAHSCLSEIYAGGKIKELLAQGVTNTRYSDKTVEQEKLERKRQLPYHMHINLELLEAVHLICAMLLEVPNMAASINDPRGKLISRTFRRLYEIHERQIFSGPPENTREVIITAAKSLSKGDWKRCEELILGLNVWNLMSKSDQVKAMIRRRIQEEGLRTYLFTYSGYYDSMSLEMLSLLFEMPKNTVHSIVSKMMISEELHASWDQPSGAIVMHRAEPTRLQFLAMQLADKAATFVENNERLLDAGRPSFGYRKEGDNKRDQSKDGRRDNKGQDRSKGQNAGRENKGWSSQRDKSNKGQSTQNYTPRQRTQAAH